ncbi:MAG: BON domain-containing protein [Candidatus Methylomirabilales bacterium]
MGLAKPRPISATFARHRTVIYLQEPWADAASLSIMVGHGIVHLWGLVRFEEEQRALRVAAEAVPGVRKVRDYLRLSPDLLPFA